MEIVANLKQEEYLGYLAAILLKRDDLLIKVEISDITDGGVIFEMDREIQKMLGLESRFVDSRYLSEINLEVVLVHTAPDATQ